MTISDHNPTPSGRRGTRLGDRLDSEWLRLRRDPDALARAATWQIAECRLDDLAEVLTATGFHTEPTPAREAACRRLAELAADDDLAARVLLQRIVPGLFAVARRWSVRTDDELGELIGAAWIAVRTFNRARRPASVAAALVADAEYRAFREPRRRRPSGETPNGHDFSALAAPDHQTDAARELLELFELADAACLAPDERELLAQLLRNDRCDAVAVALDVTPRTVRNRRDRLTHRLRQIAHAA